jgi:hypothetical protein
MGDPARQKKTSTCLIEIEGIEMGITEKISGVIESHQDHDDPPEMVDADESNLTAFCCFT